MTSALHYIANWLKSSTLKRDRFFFFFSFFYKKKCLDTRSAHTIPALFVRQVETRPDAVAVESWDTRYTYAELDRASAGLARHLSQIGLRRVQIVPLLCDKSAAVVVSLLAILCAGASCASLSPNDGVHRLRGIIVDQTKAQVVLASPNHAEKARVLGCDTVVVVDLQLVLEHSLAPNDRTGCSMDESRPGDVAFVNSPLAPLENQRVSCCRTQHFASAS